MGAYQSVHFGRAKITFGFNLFSKLCSSYMLSHRRISSTLLSLASDRLYLKHPGLLGKSDMLDVWWHEDGLNDSNILIAYRFPIPRFDIMRCLTIQYSVSPEVRTHGIPVHNFSHSVSRGLRLFNLSIGLHMNHEASIPNWTDTTSASLKHIQFMDDEGSLRRLDMDGIPMTVSRNSFDRMIVLKHESRFAEATDRCFSHSIFSSIYRWNKGLHFIQTCYPSFGLNFFASKGSKLGAALLSTRWTVGSIVGSFAPHQAFAIGGPSSVRGYGEGAVASGQSCLVATGELAIPLNKKLTGLIFLDFGSALLTSHLVPGNPGRRQGKPGYGYGYGCGIRFNTQWTEINVDYAINDFQQRTVYFGFSNLIPH